jgi:hypothetical protein
MRSRRYIILLHLLPPFILPLHTCIFILSFLSRLMFLSLNAAIPVILHTLLRLLCRLLSRLQSTMAVTHLLFGSTAPRLNLVPVETCFGCVIAVGMKGETVVKISVFNSPIAQLSWKQASYPQKT